MTHKTTAQLTADLHVKQVEAEAAKLRYETLDRDIKLQKSRVLRCNWLVERALLMMNDADYTAGRTGMEADEYVTARARSDYEDAQYSLECEQDRLQERRPLLDEAFEAMSNADYAVEQAEALLAEVAA